MQNTQDSRKIMNLDYLFPTPIALIKNPPLDMEELSFLNSLDMMHNTNNLISKDRNVLENKELLELKTILNYDLRKFFDEVYSPKTNLDIYITQSWVNINNPGRSHHSHKHTNSFISGVYYVKAKKEMHSITFSREMADPIRFPSREYNKFNSLEWTYTVETGDLILFPSYLNHSVSPNIDNEDRISLGFNSFLKGKIGDDNVSFNLELEVGNLA
ncbi:hypothetical protein EBU95_15865 [bacterium]|nr:hypothetical protein [bacterium]